MTAPATLPVIVGTVIVDLTHTPSGRQRHALWWSLGQLRDGEQVRIVVGDDLPEYAVAETIAELIEPCATRLSIEGESDEIVREWVHLVRDAVHDRILRGSAS